MPYKQELRAALGLIFEGIEKLRIAAQQRRKFTIDGRLVGDIGEFVASMEYDLLLDEKSRPGYDGRTSNGWSVQVKATFQKELTYKACCDYLGLKFNRDGTYEEIFNGPGRLIFDRYAHRKGIGTTLLRFPASELRKLSKNVASDQRIPRRDAAVATAAILQTA